MNPIDATLDDLIETFDLLGDWDGRIQHLIDLGRALPPFPEADRTADNKVPGCASQVWLTSRIEDGRLRFAADSDSHLSKGNVALLLQLYDDREPADVLAFDVRAGLDRLGLPQALTLQRANGLNAMVQRIRLEAAKAT